MIPDSDVKCVKSCMDEVHAGLFLYMAMVEAHKKSCPSLSLGVVRLLACLASKPYK